MSDRLLRKLENRRPKKTLIAMRNLHHDMTSKMILDFLFSSSFVPINNIT